MSGSCLRGGRARPPRRARRDAALAVPHTHPLHPCLDGGKRQVSALDAPGGLGPHLARRECALGDAPLAYRGTAPQLLGRLGKREPSVPLREIREAILIPDTRHTGRPPRFARPRPIAQAVQRGGHGEVTIDLGEFRHDANGIVLRRPAMLPGRIAGHP
jgi:hypothetical protein